MLSSATREEYTSARETARMRAVQQKFRTQGQLENAHHRRARPPQHRFMSALRQGSRDLQKLEASPKADPRYIQQKLDLDLLVQGRREQQLAWSCRYQTTLL